MTEDNLRDRMRRADPAASLRPLPPEETRRLVDAAVDFTADFAPLRKRHRRLPVLATATALVVVAAGVTIVVTSGPGDETPNRVVALPTTTAQPSPTTSAGVPGTSAAPPTITSQLRPHSTTNPGPSHAATPPPVTSPTVPGGDRATVTVLTDSEDPGGRCPRPEAQHLAATASLAFEGTVLRIEGNLVTLKVNRTWTGDRTDLVEVRKPGAATPALLAGFEPRTGQTYLVAAADRNVMSCGYSGPAEADLTALYDEAFPRR